MNQVPQVEIGMFKINVQYKFLADELKDEVNFSDRIPSICQLFTFSSPPPEPEGQFQPNLAQSILK